MLTTKKKKKKPNRKGNPNPNMSGLEKLRVCEEGTARKAVGFKIPASQYDAWMSLSSETRNTYLRSAVATFLKEQNLIAE